MPSILPIVANIGGVQIRQEISLEAFDIAVASSGPCTTNGEFIDEQTETGSWAMMLLDINQDHFEIYFDEYPSQNYREVAAGIARKARSRFDTPAFLIGLSHPSVDGEEILHGITDVVGEQVNVFGGGAGDDYAFQETLVFTNQKISGSGMVCIALDESKVEVQGIATCGWKAVGTEKIVTRSEGNHVYTIEGVPAVDITAKYGGLENITPNNQDLLIDLAANLPLQLQRDKGDPVMRPYPGKKVSKLVVDWYLDRSFYTSGALPSTTRGKGRIQLPGFLDSAEIGMSCPKWSKASKPHTQ